MNGAARSALAGNDATGIVLRSSLFRGPIAPTRSPRSGPRQQTRPAPGALAPLIRFSSFDIRRLLAMSQEALAALGAIAGQGLLDHRQGGRRGLHVVHLDRLAFQRLVVLEEAPQEGQAMRGQLARLGE